MEQRYYSMPDTQIDEPLPIQFRRGQGSDLRGLAVVHSSAGASQQHLDFWFVQTRKLVVVMIGGSHILIPRIRRSKCLDAKRN